MGSNTVRGKPFFLQQETSNIAQLWLLPGTDSRVLTAFYTIKLTEIQYKFKKYSSSSFFTKDKERVLSIKWHLNTTADYV